MLLPAARVAFEAEVRQKSCLRMAKLRLALKIYQKENGKFPKSLAVLSPSILNSIPKAPSRDESFVYRIEDGELRLYSLGYDGVDQDGQGVFTDARYGTADDFEFMLELAMTWDEYLAERKIGKR